MLTAGRCGSLSGSDFFYAISGLCLYAGLLKWYKWDLELYMLILSVKACLTRIGKFILCVTPV